MKKEITTENYKAILKKYKEWQELIGYSGSTIDNNTNAISELLHWLENNGITNLHKVTISIIKNYYNYLKHRNKQNKSISDTEEKLSHASLNKHLTAMRLFSDFVKQFYGITLVINIANEVVEQKNRRILSIEQVQKLYSPM